MSNYCGCPDPDFEIRAGAVPVCRTCGAVQRDFALKTSVDYWTRRLDESQYLRACLEAFRDSLPTGTVEFLRSVPREVRDRYNLEVDRIVGFLENLDQTIDREDREIERIAANVKIAKEKIEP